MGLFGGDSTKKTTTQTLNLANDNRVQVGGSAGTLISPGAAVASPGGGAVNASPYSTVTQTFTNTGFQASDVNALLDDVFAAQQQTNDALSGLAGSLGSGLQAQTQKLGDIVEATQAPTQSALTTLLPFGLLALLLFFGSKH